MRNMKRVWTYLVIVAVAMLAALNYELFVFPNSFAPSGLNGDHLNYYGAAKITRWLGDFLSDALPDHRGEAAYAAWDRDLAALPERIQAKIEETKE